jgi:hypothetical protein
LVTSDNYGEYADQVIGYAFWGETLVTKYSENLPEDALEYIGPVVFLRRASDHLHIFRDAMGYVPLFLYENGANWAIGNSIWEVLTYAMQTGEVHLNVGYAESLFTCTTYNHYYESTICREIRRISSFSEIFIDIRTGEMEEKMRDHLLPRIPLASSQGMELVDSTIDRWKRRFRALEKGGWTIQVDLSGGFDSRIGYAIAHASGIDLRQGNAYVYNLTPKNTGAEKHFAGDAEIAEMIAELHGISLRHEPVEKGERLSLQTRYRNYRHTMHGFNTQAFDRQWGYEQPFVRITGFTGESVRKNSSLVDQLYRTEWSGRSYLDRIELPQGVESLVRDFYHFTDRLARYGIRNPEMDRGLYAGENDDLFFGGQMLEYYRTGVLILSPLMDIAWRRLIVPEGLNRLLIYATILCRTCPKLLDVPVLHGEYPEEIKKTAKDLCSRYDRAEEDPSDVKPVPLPSFDFLAEFFDMQETEHLHAFLHRLFRNPKISALLERKWGASGAELYKQAEERFQRTDVFHEESSVVACLTIAEVLQAEAETTGRIVPVEENLDGVMLALRRDYPHLQAVDLLGNRYRMKRILRDLLAGKEAPDIYIYGAGKYGQALAHWFEEKHIRLTGFLQSTQPTDRMVGRWNVFSPDDFGYCSGGLIFLAVADKTERLKITELLNSRDIPEEAVFDSVEFIEQVVMAV